MTNVLSVATTRRPAAWHFCLAAGPVVISLYFWFVGLGGDWAGTQVALYVSANAALTVSCWSPPAGTARCGRRCCCWPPPAPSRSRPI